MRSLARFLDDAIPLRRASLFAGPRRPVSSDHVGRQTSARRQAGRGGAHRLVAALPALRRAAGARHEVRRRDRRDRPGQAGGRRQHERRGRAELRPDPAHAPRHLRHERGAGAGRAGAGRPVQHPGGARRSNPRLPHPVRPRRADPVLRQPGDVQPQRQGDPAAQGPHRHADPDALPAGPLRRHRDHGAGGRPRPRRRLPGAGPAVHEGDHRADQRLRPQVEIHRPGVRRQRPLLDRQLPDDGRQRPPSRRPARREAVRAAHQRPGTSRIRRRWASWSWT